MSRLAWREFEKRSKSFFEANLGIQLLEQMPIPLSTGEKHKFDISSADRTVVIECKSHTWTKSGNYPSAKVTDAQRAVELLRKCEAKRKIIVFQDHVTSQGSLVEVFVRRNASLLTGLEVWRVLDGNFIRFVDYSGGVARLEIVFDGIAKPYFQEQAIQSRPAGIVLDRRYRVGILNTGQQPVHQSRLILENCEPSEPHGVHLGYALQVMGQPQGTGEFSVYPGQVPSVFVEVVYEEIIGGRPHGNAFGLCYAASVSSHAIPKGHYVLTLRVEGDGIQSRKTFAIDRHLLTQTLMMCEVQT